MVLESWESIQGNQNVPLFARGTFYERLRVACTKAVAAELALECLRVMGLERAENRRVPLSSGFCLES